MAWLTNTKKSHFIEALGHLAVWTIYFLSINVNWSGEWFDSAKNADVIAPIPTIIFPLFFYFNAFYLIPKYLKKRLWFTYALFLALTVFGLEFLRMLLYTALSNDGTFKAVFLAEFNSTENLIFGKLTPLISSLQFSFAYRFTRDWIVNNDLIDRLRTEKLQMELSVLKAQINPHFLFNNLNALDDLIDRNPKQAKTYLNRLSKLYRYTLTSMDNDVVSLKEEWDFIDDYIYLLTERYGQSYAFSKSATNDNLHQYLIPPTALQLLIENVVKHNVASVENPLKVLIEVTDEVVKVSHDKRPKSVQPESTGKGLQNIKERFKLLSNEDVIVNNDATIFSVQLPLIQNIRMS